MIRECPICRGAGQAKQHNGVDPKDNQLQTCYFCNGSGEVDEQPTDKLHIRKYWGTFVIE